MSVLRSTRLLRSSVTRWIAFRASSSSSLPATPLPVPSEQPNSSTPKEYQQSPNRAEVWSTSQNPKPHAYDDARFEQVDLQFQPNPKSAMQMIAEEPIRLVEGRKAVCDGGGGPLGHPKIYINLDKPGPKMCGYCGIRFEKAHVEH